MMRMLPKRSRDTTMFIILNLILRRETKWSLEGPMADTGSSFEAPLRYAPQYEVVGFHPLG